MKYAAPAKLENSTNHSPLYGMKYGWDPAREDARMRFGPVRHEVCRSGKAGKKYAAPAKPENSTNRSPLYGMEYAVQIKNLTS